MRIGALVPALLIGAVLIGGQSLNGVIAFIEYVGNQCWGFG